MKTVLEGKRILLTRPKNQYAEWADRLSSLGAVPFSFPLIEINPISNSEEIKLVLEKLDIYEWIIFTSINSAKYFLDILTNNGIRKLKSSIAAIGSKTAAYLEQSGYSVDFIPGIYTAIELAESIPDINGKNILLPRTDIADDELFSGLSRRGAKVNEVTVYTTRKITDQKEEFQKLMDKGLDVVTFASPSVVEAFCELGINKGKSLIACIGPVTAEKSIEKGLKPDIVAKTFTAEGLTQAMLEYFKT